MTLNAMTEREAQDKELIKSLHGALLLADKAWSAALKDAFGKAAGDRRYDTDKSDHPGPCKRAHARLRDARARFNAHGGYDALFGRRPGQ